MSKITKPIPLPVSRGPVEHARREQIVAAACEQVRAHGYGKTSVAEVAKAVGVSSAYVYRFFESKQSIGEAVCAENLARIAQSLFDLENAPWTAAEKLRRFYSVLLESGYELFIAQRNLHELVSSAVSQNWIAAANHRKVIRAVLRRIVVEGRKNSEFERDTPLDEVVLALGQAAIPFAHPILLAQRDLKDLRMSAAAVSGLVLRGLAPSSEQ